MGLLLPIFGKCESDASGNLLGAGVRVPMLTRFVAAPTGTSVRFAAFGAERPARQEADASAPSESAAPGAAQQPEAANDPIDQWTNAALPTETEKAVGATSAAETGSEGAGRAAEDVEDDETARRRREDEEDDEARLRPPVQEPPAPNATWAGLRGRCLEKAKGFWTYQVCVGEGVQQFHYTSSHGVAEQTKRNLFTPTGLGSTNTSMQRSVEVCLAA